jgi:hypothetical protein
MPRTTGWPARLQEADREAQTNIMQEVRVFRQWHWELAINGRIDPGDGKRQTPWALKFQGADESET